MLAVVYIFALTLPLFVRQKTEAGSLTNLTSPKANAVISALQSIEKNYPTDTGALVEVKDLLTDPRLSVKCKAARVLGAVNADVSADDLKNIITLLDAPDKGTVTDELKALRGLEAQSTISKSFRCYRTLISTSNAMPCTLAVLGDKSLVPTIQPFLTFPDSAVQKDAADAINILKEK